MPTDLAKLTDTELNHEARERMGYVGPVAVGSVTLPGQFSPATNMNDVVKLADTLCEKNSWWWDAGNVIGEGTHRAAVYNWKADDAETAIATAGDLPFARALTEAVVAAARSVMSESSPTPKRDLKPETAESPRCRHQGEG